MTDNLPPLPPCAPEFKPRWPNDPGGYAADQMQAYARAAIERQSVPDLNRLTPFVSGLGKAILQEFIEDMAAAPQPQPVLSPPVPPEVVACLHAYGDSRADDDGLSGLRIAEAIVALRRWAAAEKAAEPQPQPVPPEGPMAETVEQAARDVAKCLNERDGQGLDLRHVAMLAHYAQQPVQEPVKGWWAHTCPEDGKVDVVNYQLTPADKRAGWVEHEVYTSPQAQPQPVQEPVYQYQCANGSWVDQTKESYDYNVRNGWATVRVLYTSPQAQPQPVQEQCPECDGTGTVAGSQAHFPCPICTSPQEAQPLTHLQAKALVEKYGNDPLHLIFQTEAAHGITKGTT